ncbi:hypothetical protein [Asticcacaulis sp.]|uniref:hypothetical protein n=1 Tax=Asticcacaulis sp. TaxID=1872648 RepID=UPI00262DD6C4|nr:hypothetical protein [Asticcacaulis sp.]
MKTFFLTILGAIFFTGCSSSKAVTDDTCEIFQPGDTRYSHLRPIGWSLLDPNPDSSSTFQFYSDGGENETVSLSTIFALSEIVTPVKTASVLSKKKIEIHYTGFVNCDLSPPSDNMSICLDDYCRLEFSVKLNQIRKPKIYILSRGEKHYVLRHQPVCIASAMMFLAGQHGAWGKISEADFTFSDDNIDWFVSPASKLAHCIRQFRGRIR